MKSELAVKAQAVPTSVQSVTPMDMLRLAIEKDADLEKLKQLVELQERWEANEARKAYVVAMAEYRKDPPSIYKTKAVSFETSKGTTEYSHALLEDAAEIIGSALSKHGLSFRWETEQLDGGQVRVTCVITHVLGHSERTSLQAGLDLSGGKNNIQALGSTVSYLERYTLMAATGSAPKGVDNDATGAGEDEVEYITPEQAENLTKLLETPSGKLKFCEHFKVQSIEKLPAKAYAQALALTESRRKLVEEKRKLAPKNNEGKQ